MTKRDFQKQRVYNWEDKYVRPKMPINQRPIEMLEVIGTHVWSAMGFENVPRILYNPRYKMKSTGGRYEILLSQYQQDEFTLIHEMAHSMNLMEHRAVYDNHGPNYVADYCTLLCKFYGFDINYLMYTLKKSKVKINLGQFYANNS